MKRLVLGLFLFVVAGPPVVMLLASSMTIGVHIDIQSLPEIVALSYIVGVGPALLYWLVDLVFERFTLSSLWTGLTVSLIQAAFFFNASGFSWSIFTIVVASGVTAAACSWLSRDKVRKAAQ